MNFATNHRGNTRTFRLTNDKIQLTWRHEMGRPVRHLIVGTAEKAVTGELIGEDARVFRRDVEAEIRSAMADECLVVLQSAQEALEAAQ